MPETGNAEPQAQHPAAIALRARFAQAMALHRQGNLADAERLYREVLQQQPNHFDALHLLEVIALQTQHTEQAVELIGKAIGLDAKVAGAHCNLGKALRDLNRPEEALASYDTAIGLEPDFAMAHNNRGNALGDLNRPAEALVSYDKAIALKPDYAEAYWNRSLYLLLMGRFEQGWRLHEWRKKHGIPIAARSFPQPLWLGEEDIAGKTLFLWYEQGFGDTIQFCRYAKLAEARGAKVIMSVQQALQELLQEISPTIQIINQDEVPTDFDYHCPLLSLPLAFGTTLETIPANIPYLRSDSEKALFWKEKLGEKNKPRVGLVWSGGFRPDQPELWSINRRRNIPLAKLAALKNPDIEFYSLQKGQPAESELAELTRDNWGGPEIVDFTSLLNNFSDTAALVAKSGPGDLRRYLDCSLGWGFR